MPLDFAPAITSRENALIKQLHKLAHEGNAYRKLGQIWLEGEHLTSSFLLKWQAETAIKKEAAQAGFSALNGKTLPKKLIVAASYETQLPQFLAQYGLAVHGATLPCPVQLVADSLLPAISSLESPAPIGLLLEVAPEAAPRIERLPTVVLDRLQDAGNVGAILRCAAAFGFRQIVAIKGTVGLWSTKVLRAGMGAHFGLQLHELCDSSDTLAQLQTLALPLLATSSHQGSYLHQAQLPSPCAWLLGHEGQGVSTAWQQAATGHIRIWQAAEESLNVATAAAICLHASAAQAMLNPPL
jgi:TrmH family RNA methyltransferase